MEGSGYAEIQAWGHNVSRPQGGVRDDSTTKFILEPCLPDEHKWAWEAREVGLERLDATNMANYSGSDQLLPSKQALVL